MHRFRSLVFAACLGACAGPAAALVAYHDGLVNGFQDWSWPSGAHNLANATPALGAASIRMAPAGWNGVFLHAGSAFLVTDYEAVRFSIHGGGATGQLLRLRVQLGGSSLASVALAGFLPGGQVPTNSWAQITVPFSALVGLSGSFDGIVFQADQAATQPAVYLDEVELIANSTPPPPPTPIAVRVDPWADRHPISPLIYGVNFGDPAQVASLRYPLRRWGGNSTTRYNWQVDIGNHASDYFFQVVPEGPDLPSLPDGSSADVFVDQTLAAGGQVLMTVPTIGWTAKPAPDPQPRDKSWSFSVAKYGPQDLVECSIYDPVPTWCSWDAGNGECNPAVNTNPAHCDPATGFILNDPNDASQPITTQFVKDWVDHLKARAAADGGVVRYYALDNEAMLWNSTHRDVHPAPATYDEVWINGLAMARAIKQRDPAAQVMGPVTWGWCDLFASAADNLPDPSDFNSCTTGPDRAGHGGKAFVPWYLEQVCTAAAPRPVDVLDIHYYPQGGVDGLGGSGSGEDAATSAKRLRSLKELYDPTWTAESWVGDQVRLIPRLKEWIAQECPGIKLAITEYKWGPDNGPSGALAQAEVLAIFGREGVDLATRWVAPAPGTLAEDAFELYLSYDGAGARVDGDSVRATSADREAVTTYAVRGAPSSLFVLLFNHDTVARDAQVTVASRMAAGALPLYRFAGGQPLASAGTATRTASGFSAPLPARSATLAVVPLDLGNGLLQIDDFEGGDVGHWLHP